MSARAPKRFYFTAGDIAAAGIGIESAAALPWRETLRAIKKIAAEVAGRPVLWRDIFIHGLNASYHTREGDSDWRAVRVVFPTYRIAADGTYSKLPKLPKSTTKES